MKWHKYSEEKPTVEGEYLTCRIRSYGVIYCVCMWTNNLYNTDEWAFFDGELGYYKVDCDYWCEIEFDEV